jgi:predicted permease
MRRFFRRAFALLHRRRLERQLAEDMAAHREMMPPERRRHFGSDLRLREEAADQWGWTWIDHFRQDLTYGARQLRRSPGFTLTAVAVLSLGIGVNLAEVHLFEAAVHRLQVRDPDSLCQFYRVTKQGLGRTLSLPAIDFYTRHNTVLSAVITETNVGGVLHEGDSDALQCSLVSANFFSELGIVPAYGRLLDEQDGRDGAPPVAVLSYRYWQNRFGGDPSIVGKTIRLNDRPVEVVGIAPPQFAGLVSQAVPFWMPVAQYAYLTGDPSPAAIFSDFGALRTYMIGRLKPGVSLAAAEAQFRSLTAELRAEEPKYVGWNDWLQVKSTETPVLSGGPAVALAIATIVVLVLLVLLSACANLGNMLLARGLARQREIEIRLAVGAGRWRLLRQLMTENLLLALVASAAALVVGRMAGRLFVRITGLPPNFRIVTDWRIVAACATLGLAATFAFGLAPAFQAVRRGPSATRARKMLVAVQVAVSCLLLVLSSYLTRAVRHAFDISVTFDYREMVLADPAFYLHHYTPAEAREAAGAIAARLRRVPGVDGAAIATIPPFRRSSTERVSGHQLYLNEVEPAYFAMMRLPLVAGRLFGADEPDAVVVSESAARKMWPNQPPVGKVCLIDGRSRTVTGVVQDSGVNLVGFPESAEAYLPVDDRNAVYATVLVHTRGRPRQLAGAIHAAATIPGILPAVVVYQDLVDSQVNSMKLMVALFGTLGAVATMLALAGIFGLLAFTVAQRTREIGVRMALGGRGRNILWVVLGQYALPFGGGAAAGVLLAAASSRVIFSTIFGYQPLDLASIGGGLLLFGAAALAASMAPVRRALRIDPSSALRYE